MIAEWLQCDDLLRKYVTKRKVDYLAGILRQYA